MPNLTRYERFAWDYERFNPLEERVVSWHRGVARATGDPILELACGTGRLVASLAADGHDVVGLDLTDAMLERARARIDELDDEVKGRVRLVHADMQSFDVDEHFGLVILADNSVRELSSRDAILACLQRVRAHLKPEGRFVVTERRFDPSLLDDAGERAWSWTAPVPDPSTGGTMQRRVKVRYDADEKRLHAVLTYRTSSPEGEAEEQDFAFDSPVLGIPGYLALFEEAGFSAEVCTGYGEHLDEGHDTTICFVARPTP